MALLYKECYKMCISQLFFRFCKMPLGGMKGGAYIGDRLSLLYVLILREEIYNVYKVHESMCVKYSECRGMI